MSVSVDKWCLVFEAFRPSDSVTNHTAEEDEDDDDDLTGGTHTQTHTVLVINQCFCWWIHQFLSKDTGGFSETDQRLLFHR